jgi:F-type H+-transporting ATPase subunit b
VLLAGALALAPQAARAAEGGGAPPLLDWPLFVTQVAGFLLLLWGLRAFAWGPLIGLIEDRRRKIAEEFAEAEQRQAAADEAKARLEQELKGIEARARQKLVEAVAEGQKVAGEIRAQAHADAAARLARAAEEIVHEREKAEELLKERVATLSIRTAEKILREKIDDAAQRKLVERFIDEVSAQP